MSLSPALTAPFLAVPRRPRRLLACRVSAKRHWRGMGRMATLQSMRGLFPHLHRCLPAAAQVRSRFCEVMVSRQPVNHAAGLLRLLQAAVVARLHVSLKGMAGHCPWQTPHLPLVKKKAKIAKDADRQPGSRRQPLGPSERLTRLISLAMSPRRHELSSRTSTFAAHLLITALVFPAITLRTPIPPCRSSCTTSFAA